jgi:hypothetical protein
LQNLNVPGGKIRKQNENAKIQVQHEMAVFVIGNKQVVAKTVGCCSILWVTEKPQGKIPPI